MYKDMNKEEWQQLFLIHGFAIEEIKIILNRLYETYESQGESNPIEHIKTRLKSYESIARKLEQKEKPVNVANAKRYLNDIAGVRIICAFTSDIYGILEALIHQTDIKVIDIKDYIQNPKASGYQSLHILVDVRVQLSDCVERVPVEVQIRTIAMDYWATLEHKLRYKYFDKAPAHIALELKKCASIIKDLDRKMMTIKEEIDRYEVKDKEGNSTKNIEK
ncbi:GTP pyrophosphokinase [Petrocella sp. FN5]|uniref:GTP pyrophosphokinase n=1 Tax=Petrocella sp. FN5 TaxID=3032002 RepID=UPI0023DC8A43|nr:GTP pyrophosphokinase family protein [Petrocella sp. FN5]MDF1617810.1 GTP pyrophosphokinase family protein [Petrocella sp. FN5]